MSHSGESNLDELVKLMNPNLEDEVFVFSKLPLDSKQALDFMVKISDLGVKMLFREREAWTLILPKSMANAEKLEYMFECRQITLNVHSSLDAVGFLAAITTELASKLRIGVNPVSGFYHDHLFVPTGTEEQVIEALRQMSAARGQRDSQSTISKG
ncbi:hypothetical protein CBER1_01046 [Cercospora berteroae]|uniref:DUF2241 domain-containing protein n=1 Tax=Cercospora berteroae TaxID=357750 RepID=A0A2S6C2Y7_9PEZI|nr:hypothetical protein CBER1_01046 [Cercospora berteroae]